MRKFYPPLLVLIFLLSAFSISAATAENVTETFGNWFKPASKPNDATKTEITSSTTKITYTSIHTYYNASSTAILMVGSSTAKGEISFTLPYAISKLTLKSGKSTGTKGAVAVYAGEVKITTSNVAIDNTSTDYPIDIPANYQVANTTFKIVQTTSKNTQFQSFTYTKVEEDGVKAPTFNVTSDDAAVAGWYPNNATVAITAETGATIYYTTDGVTEPTDKSLKYESPRTFTKTTTVKAIAYLNGKNSDVSETTVKIGVPPASHETTYTFDFSKKDFGANTVYGLAVHSGTDASYEKKTSNIERKGVKLTITPPSSGNAHRIWDTSGATDLRMYLSSMTFSVPEGGFIKSVEFTKSGSDWKAPKINDTSTTLSGLKWTAADDVNSVKFTFTAKSFIKGITVTYDLGKPAPPCIVTETETAIHVSCDEGCTLEYKKVVHTPKANGPARANSIVDDAADWTPLDVNIVEIEKINNKGKQFSFRAKHTDSGAVSDETAFAVNADGTTTGVESVEAEEADAPVEYFNLQGVRVMNPDKGLFIRRQGNRVEKVMMK